ASPAKCNEPVMRIGSLCSRALRSEEHTSELQSRENLVCRLLLEKKKKITRRASRHDACCLRAWAGKRPPGGRHLRLPSRLSLPAPFVPQPCVVPFFFFKETGPPRNLPLFPNRPLSD